MRIDFLIFIFFSLSSSYLILAPLNFLEKNENLIGKFVDKKQLVLEYPKKKKEVYELLFEAVRVITMFYFYQKEITEEFYYPLCWLKGLKFSEVCEMKIHSANF